MVILDFIGLVIVLAIIGTVVNWWGKRDERRDLRSAAQRASIATAALRRIANGAGNPALEASIALDEIEATYLKELS